MISKELLLSELCFRAKSNEEEGHRLEDAREFEAARFYFGGASALRELMRDLDDDYSC